MVFGTSSHPTLPRHTFYMDWTDRWVWRRCWWFGIFVFYFTHTTARVEKHFTFTSTFYHSLPTRFPPDVVPRHAALRFTLRLHALCRYCYDKLPPTTTRTPPCYAHCPVRTRFTLQRRLPLPYIYYPHLPPITPLPFPHLPFYQQNLLLRRFPVHPRPSLPLSPQTILPL